MNNSLQSRTVACTDRLPQKVHEIYNKSTGFLKNLIETRRFSVKMRHFTTGECRRFPAKAAWNPKRPGKNRCGDGASCGTRTGRRKGRSGQQRAGGSVRYRRETGELWEKTDLPKREESVPGAGRERGGIGAPGGRLRAAAGPWRSGAGSFDAKVSPGCSGTSDHLGGS